jgi:hypothetical protein
MSVHYCEYLTYQYSVYISGGSRFPRRRRVLLKVLRAKRTRIIECHAHFGVKIMPILIVFEKKATRPYMPYQSSQSVFERISAKAC